VSDWPKCESVPAARSTTAQICQPQAGVGDS
jgi:hypothetical protein